MSIEVTRGWFTYAQRPVPAIGTQTLTDDFNRANQNPLAGNWTTNDAGEADNMELFGNHALAHNGNDASAYWTSWASGDDQYSQVEVTDASDHGTGVGAGVCVRRAAAAITMYRLIISGTGGTIELSRLVAGAFQQLTTRSVTFSSGAKLGLSVQGTTLKIWYAGAQQGANVTDSNIASGKPGLTWSGPTTAPTVDNWDAGTVP